MEAASKSPYGQEGGEWTRHGELNEWIGRTMKSEMSMSERCWIEFCNHVTLFSRWVTTSYSRIQ